jgi:chemotaxis protein MotB
MTRIGLFLVAVLVMASSCVSSKKHKDLMAEKDAIMSRLDKCNDEKNELNAQLRGLEDEKAKMKTELANKDRELVTADKKLMDCQKLSEERAAMIKAVKKQINMVAETMKEAGLTVEDKEVKLHVTLSNNILYTPGGVEISKEGKEVIGKLAEVFKNNPMEVIVEGHTDGQRVRRSRWKVEGKDNWGLSVARSANVVRALVDAGVDPAHLVVAGRADNDRVVDTDEGGEAGSANRRIEFILSPTDENLQKLAN